MTCRDDRFAGNAGLCQDKPGVLPERPSTARPGMYVSRIKIRHLQCFIEVARLRSVVSAADALSLTQPAVSRTLRELEDILEVRLFHRERNRMVLTRYGEVLLKHAGAAIASIHTGQESIQQLKSVGGSRITLGCLPSVSADLMPQALVEFKKESPRTSVVVLTGSNSQLLSQLRVGDVDAVIGRLAEPADMAGLRFQHLYYEPFRFVVRAGHPLLSRPDYGFADLADYPFVTPLPGAVIRREFDHFMKMQGVVELPDRLETQSMSLAHAYVRETDAIWPAPSGVSRRDLENGDLRALDLDGEMMTGAVGLTTVEDFDPPPLCEMMIGIIKKLGTERARSESE